MVDDPGPSTARNNSVIGKLEDEMGCTNFIKHGDLEKIKSLDLLGVNYYSRNVMKFSLKNVPLFRRRGSRPAGNEYSDMWEIYPPGMYDLLKRIWDDYYVPAQARGEKMPELMITENGVPVPDVMTSDGQVRDERRIRYLRDHLAQVHRAIQSGVDVKGYYVWSFADNFEWNLGYGPRFGLIHIDYETLDRTIKTAASGLRKSSLTMVLTSENKMRRIILAAFVIIILLSATTPAKAGETLLVYYAGDENSGVYSALELTGYTLVTDPAIADVYVLNGEIPSNPVISERIKSGDAGLVLILGESTHRIPGTGITRCSSRI